MNSRGVKRSLAHAHTLPGTESSVICGRPATQMWSIHPQLQIGDHNSSSMKTRPLIRGAVSIWANQGSCTFLFESAIITVAIRIVVCRGGEAPHAGNTSRYFYLIGRSTSVLSAALIYVALKRTCALQQITLKQRIDSEPTIAHSCEEYSSNGTYSISPSNEASHGHLAWTLAGWSALTFEVNRFSVTLGGGGGSVQAHSSNPPNTGQLLKYRKW